MVRQQKKGDAMQDLIVVVPGITGTVLRRDGHAVWNLSLSAVGRGIVGFTRTAESLRLPDDVGTGSAPPTMALEVGGLVNGWHLWPGVYGGPGYRRLVDVLTETARGAVRTFGYDWRLSNRHTARLLAANVESWLNDWRSSTGNADAKVIFVCHSMGGLLARYYLEVLGGREHTRRLITLGTPYRGSVNAIRALTGDAFSALRPFGRQAVLTEVARSFPALWELLPTYRCVAGPGGPVSLPEARLTDLPSGALADGLSFHDEIATAVAGNSSPQYHLHAFAGKRQATWQSLTLDHGRRKYRHLQRDEDYRGDGTVPLFSAVPPEWASTEGAICQAVRHGGLCLAAAVLDLVLDKIEPLEMGDVLSPPCELGLDLPDIAGTGEPLVIRVDSDREDLLLHVRLEDPATNQLMAEAQMMADGSGGYQASLEPIPGSWRVTVEAIAERPLVRVEDLITIVATPEPSAPR
jgi:pimeloyl-ACP methyl ester carboxylesterase